MENYEVTKYYAIFSGFAWRGYNKHVWYRPLILYSITYDLGGDCILQN